MKYYDICEIKINSLPKRGIYAGYNPNLKKHIILTRNPSDKKDIIPLFAEELEEGEKSSINQTLDDDELKFAKKILLKAGL